ncbi:BTAD domain-containing putative transcriptional regulator [Catenuloplanes sp. NPDC051500]|uniref:AfsR/SARP family transcriptional regulator n=1 Tax=Catenuloplanes sp. NPDC051500 TaxID=3363959 RepID=UPI0037A010A8
MEQTEAPLFAVLGPLAVADADGSVTPLPPGRRRTLLAALLQHRNRWVDNDTLAAALWEARADYPSSISGSIKTYIHQLRKILPEGTDGEARLAGRGGAYRLTVASDELDADVFEALVTAGVAALGRDDPAKAAGLQRRALALWRGTPEEDTLDPVAARHLDELRWTARYTLADALIAAGDPGEAIVLARAMLTEDRLREPAWERLVIAQRAAGWQVDALASYEAARVLLLDTFGAEPGSRLREAYRALLSETADRAVSPARPPVAAVLPMREPAVPSPAGRPRRVSAALLALIMAGVLVLAGGSATPALSGTGGTGGGVAAQAVPKILFGLGPDPAQAQLSPLMQTGVGMMTTWYHKQGNLEQFEGWRADVIPQVYASGRALHVIVGTWEKPESVETRFGRGCGQPYPLSDEFLPDMQRLAAAFAGPADGPPLYISMFSGLQHLTCADDGYLNDAATTNYYLALKDRYFDLMRVMRAAAPNLRIGLNWDGWNASHDEPETGAGLSMFQYFVEAMRASDFQSFGAFTEDGNAEHIVQMVHELGKYGPVMVSHYGPHEDSLTVYRDDLQQTFQPDVLARLVADGLFAFSFKDPDLQRQSPELMTLTATVVRDYGRYPPTG